MPATLPSVIRTSCRACGNNTSNTNRLCDTCRASYFICSNCRAVTYLDQRSNDNECESCAYSGIILECYAKPVLQPLGNAPFLGVELEVESNDRVLRTARKVHDAFPREFLITKSDGSLSDNGFEICTRPASLDVHKATWQPFFERVSQRTIGALRSYDADNCGLHVHISKDGLSQHTIALIVCFVNLPKNKRFVELMANRYANRYTMLKHKPMRTAALPTGDKYEAVNLEHQHTLEFRIFKGTLKAASFFKALEFTEAITRFCTATFNTRKALSVNEFIKFVKANESRYPYLSAYISNRWYGKTSPLFPDGQHWALCNNAKPPLPPVSLTSDRSF